MYLVLVGPVDGHAIIIDAREGDGVEVFFRKKFCAEINLDELDIRQIDILLCRLDPHL